MLSYLIRFMLYVSCLVKNPCLDICSVLSHCSFVKLQSLMSSLVKHFLSLHFNLYLPFPLISESFLPLCVFPPVRLSAPPLIVATYVPLPLVYIQSLSPFVLCQFVLCRQQSVQTKDLCSDIPQQSLISSMVLPVCFSTFCVFIRDVFVVLCFHLDLFDFETVSQSCI